MLLSVLMNFICPPVSPIDFNFKHFNCLIPAQIGDRWLSLIPFIFPGFFESFYYMKLWSCSRFSIWLRSPNFPLFGFEPVGRYWTPSNSFPLCVVLWIIWLQSNRMRLLFWFSVCFREPDVYPSCLWIQSGSRLLPSDSVRSQCFLISWDLCGCEYIFYSPFVPWAKRSSVWFQVQSEDRDHCSFYSSPSWWCLNFTLGFKFSDWFGTRLFFLPYCFLTGLKMMSSDSRYFSTSQYICCALMERFGF